MQHSPRKILSLSPYTLSSITTKKASSSDITFIQNFEKNKFFKKLKNFILHPRAFYPSTDAVPV